jgi:murein DD-endopeptidase MepM/ murein hydrolase activator NlpD
VVIAVFATVRFVSIDDWMTASANEKSVEERAGLTAPLPLPAADAAASAEPASVAPSAPTGHASLLDPSVTHPDTPGPAAAVGVTKTAVVETLTSEAQEPLTPVAVASPASGTPEADFVDSLLGDEAGTTEPVVALATPEPESTWVEHEIRRGDTLAAIFQANGLSPAVLHGIVNSSDDAKTLAAIRPGQLLRMRVSGASGLEALELERSRVETLRVLVDDDTYSAERVHKDVDIRVATATGVIESSLFIDGQKAGLSDRVIMELANIFGWDIDFALEIRAGDAFRLVYEQHFLDGEKLRDGPILAAEFVNRGEIFRAIRYENRDGDFAYYDDEGMSKRRAFLRTPIKFGRISSGFNPKRWHPVLKKWRSHKGVDYAAPTGTPILASGDGRVIFRGTKGGYGNTVILQHAGKYTTLYAHMSKFARKVQNGSRVKQGQVIGYVGMTGLATGPHLHYEFRVEGVHKDPLRVKLPKSLALPETEIPQFKTTAAPLLAQLEEIGQKTLVASAEQAGGTEQQ